jgi:hypothetical protein
MKERRQGHGHGGDATSEWLSGLGSFMQNLPASAMSSLSGPALKSMPTTTASTIEEISPILRKDAKRIRITYGPYNIKGAKVSNGTSWTLISD